MNTKLNLLDAIIYGTGLLLFIGLMASVIFSVLEEKQTVNKVNTVNNVFNNVTTLETEVYRVVCVEEKSGYCGEYSVRRIVKE